MAMKGASKTSLDPSSNDNEGTGTNTQLVRPLLYTVCFGSQRLTYRTPWAYEVTNRGSDLLTRLIHRPVKKPSVLFHKSDSGYTLVFCWWNLIQYRTVKNERDFSPLDCIKISSCTPRLWAHITHLLCYSFQFFLSTFFISYTEP